MEDDLFDEVLRSARCTAWPRGRRCEHRDSSKILRPPRLWPFAASQRERRATRLELFFDLVLVAMFA
jgi:hypothetical protein